MRCHCPALVCGGDEFKPLIRLEIHSYKPDRRKLASMASDDFRMACLVKLDVGTFRT